MRLPSFCAKYVGQPVDRDGAYGPQCVDLVNQWAEEGLGLPVFGGNALAIAGQARNGWRWIPNAPENYPAPGDVVVWAAFSPTAHTGQYGHTAVCILADANAMISFDQNWRGVESPAIVQHHYGGIVGWQTPDRPRPRPSPNLPSTASVDNLSPGTPPLIHG